MTYLVRGIAFIGMLVFLGAIQAQTITVPQGRGCPAGYSQVGEKDCSAKKSHNRSCDADYGVTTGVASAAYWAARDVCDEKDDPHDIHNCRQRASVIYAAAMAAATNTRRNCRRRAPDCQITCQRDDPDDHDCPSGSDPVSCALVGGSWDHNTEECIL